MTICLVESPNITLVNVRPEDRNTAVSLVDRVIEEPDGHRIGLVRNGIFWGVEKTRAGHIRIRADYYFRETDVPA